MNNTSTTTISKCRKCNNYFAPELFLKKHGKITTVCLLCERKRQRKFYEKNKIAINKKHKEYRELHKEERHNYDAIYREKNKEKIAQWHKEDKKKNPEKYKNWSKKYQTENKEKLKTYLNKWRKGRTEKTNKNARDLYWKNREKILAQKKKKYEDNKDHMHEYQKQWRADHPDSVSKYLSKYLQNNLDKHAQKQSRRRARIAQNGDDKYSVQEWKNLCSFYGNKCLCCGKTKVKLTVDHVLPIKLGGRNIIENIQPLCGSCNSKKGAKHIDYRP